MKFNQTIEHSNLTILLNSKKRLCGVLAMRIVEV